MSIGELASMYAQQELDLHPEFERYFRWTPEQKSRLIESLLLGIPLPSIFVSQRKDGVWDVIDGLQRLSTIFQLMGILRDDRGKVVEPLVLMGTKYLPALADRRWTPPDSAADALGSANQRIIKRSKLDVKIILRESDEQSKYELFQRLNTGGSLLSDQEVRNCILIMADQQRYRWLRSLAADPHFQQTIAITDRAADEQYDMELAVRFLVFRRMPPDKLRAIGDLGDFLTDSLPST